MTHQALSTTDLLPYAVRILDKYKSRILFAYLFGSMASGEEHVASDVDIAVFCATPETAACFDLKLELHSDLCRELRRNDVDVVILNTTKNLMLLDEIIRKGTVLYESDPGARADFEITTILKGIDFKNHRCSVIGM